MILTTIDTSTLSESAMAVAAETAVAFGEPLTLLLVIDGPLRHHFDELGRDTGLADRIRLDDPDLAVTTVAVHATDAGSTIVDAASDPAVRMVVMATHGRSGLSKLFAGSVTTHVLRTVGRPVLVVPPVREATED